MTDIGGNVGVGPGGTVGGFPPGIVTGGGVLDGSDPFSMAAAAQAAKDLTTAYNVMPPRQHAEPSSAPI